MKEQDFRDAVHIIFFLAVLIIFNISSCQNIKSRENDWRQWAEESEQLGYDRGYEEGYKEGQYDRGDEYWNGLEDGYAQGYSDGYQDALKD